MIASFKAKSDLRTRVRVSFTSAASWAGGVSPFADFNLGAGTVAPTGCSATITPIAGGFLCTVTATPTVDGGTCALVYTILDGAGATSYAGTAGWGVYIAEIQLELGSVATRYQRYNTSADYDGVGFPRFLKLDGVNDNMASVTPVNLTGVSQVAVVSGIRHTENAVPYFLMELSPNVGANAGSFYLTTPESTGGEHAIYRNVGGNAAGYMGLATGKFRDTMIEGYIDLTGTTLATEIPIFKINGVDHRTTPIGTYANTAGTFGSHTLYLGMRGGVSFATDGRFFGLWIRGAATSAQVITDVRTDMATRAGFVA